ncbi:hypothetical protein TYRP_019516 [Tyrophagus putrescentiae]|nr:hypothetical protein TYRP_019516 [Tyrophagus putrescentiae]
MGKLSIHFHELTEFFENSENMLIVRRLFPSALKAHYNAFFVHLDAVQSIELPVDNYRPPHFHFLIPLFTDFAAILFGIFLLEFDATGKISFRELPTSPNLAFHQIFPPSIWTQIDGLVYVTVPVEMLIFTVLTMTTFAREPYQLRLNMGALYSGAAAADKQEKLNTEFTLKLLKFRRMAKYLLELAIVSGFAFAFSNLYLMLLLRSVYWFSFISALFWLIIFPMFVFYQIYGYFVPAIYVIIYNFYITLMQTDQLARFADLQQKLLQQQFQDQKCSSLKLNAAWLQYQDLNSRILKICQLTTEYSRIWCPYLSVLLPGYILSISYCVFLLTSKSELRLTETFMFTLCAGQLVLFLYLFTRQCSRVIWYNDKLTTINQTFSGLFSRQYRQSRMRALPAQMLLKIESYSDSRRFYCYAFTLFDNYKIEASSFYLIVSYIVLFYLLIFKKANKL